MKREKLGRNSTKWVITGGFAVLFLVCMFMMTYTVRQDFEEDYILQVVHMLMETKELIKINAKLFQEYELLYDENNNFTDRMISEIEELIHSQLNNTDQFLIVNMGITDSEGKLLVDAPDYGVFQFLAQSTTFNAPDWVETRELIYRKLDFTEYFSEEEINEIRSYYEKAGKDDFQRQGKSYEYKIYYDENTEKMVFFTISEMEDRKGQKGDIQTVELKTVFRWMSPEYIPPKTLNSQNLYETMSGDIRTLMCFPYLQYGRQYWEEWKNDEALQNLELEEGIRYAQVAFGLNDLVETDKTYGIRINFRIHSWQAAFHHLEDIYIYSAVIMALCLVIVLYFIDQTYKKQAQLEVLRRDFTNAVAHELKTPLAVVRNLAENLDEEESEEQKHFYTREIVNQTEQMDELVKEMILISRLDSDGLQGKKEEVSIREVIENQISKLEMFIDEKNLRVQCWQEEDLVLMGDKTYLDKAMFHLLENAVSYNKPDGGISIHLEKDSCIIENTADPIPEEDLPHVCEMFFTSNKSRTTDAKHKGLGLYLTKRILDMHGIGFKIENTDIGVKVTLVRK